MNIKLLKLSFKNLAGRKLESLLAGISIAISVGLLGIFLGLSKGISGAAFSGLEKSSPINQIRVLPQTEESNVISLLGSTNENALTEETIQEISKLPNISAIHKEIQFKNFSSINASILGMKLSTDSLVFGVSKDFIAPELQNPDAWDSKEQPYPAVISKRILDLYNFAIAIPKNIPELKEENLIGKTLELELNRSTLFASNADTKKVRIEILAFSDKVNLIGVSMPIDLVQEFNNEHFGPSEPLYTELFVEVTDPSQISETAEAIESLNLRADYLQKNFQAVEAKLGLVNNSLFLITGIILIVSAVAIISTFLAKISERKKEIALYIALGADKKQIRHLILYEAALISILASLFGTATSFLAAKPLSHYFENKINLTSFQNGSLISIDMQTATFVFLFGIVLTLIISYLPAIRASRISPIQSLK